jgi:hypothetical protein
MRLFLLSQEQTSCTEASVEKGLREVVSLTSFLSSLVHTCPRLQEVVVTSLCYHRNGDGVVEEKGLGSKRYAELLTLLFTDSLDEVSPHEQGWWPAGLWVREWNTGSRNFCFE